MMPHRRAHLLTAFVLCLAACHPAAAQDARAIANEHVTVSVVLAGDDAYGFRFTAGDQSITTIELCNGSRWVAKKITHGDSRDGKWITLSEIDTAGTGGTPALAPESLVKVTLTNGSPYPRVDFRLVLQSFNSEAWRAALKPDAPLYFLRATLPGTTYHYQGGGLIPDPEVETYPLSMKKYMAGEWSDGWSYAPALAAWAVPAAGLWNHREGHFIAYDFNHARHTDRSCKYLATAYCAGNGDHAGKFVSLVHPYQRKWTELTYPDAAETVESHFDLLYSFDLPSTADANMFVLQRLFRDYRDLLPPAPRMNDVGWIHREDRWTPPVGLPRTQAGCALVGKSGPTGLAGAFLELGTTMLGNSFISDGLRHVLNTEQTAAVDRLKENLDYLAKEAVWFDVEGDRCVSWHLPLAGKFKERWGGERARGIYHPKTWQAGTAFLLMYEQEKTPEYLRFVDGVYNWTRHFVHTRDGVCDLPWAMFSRVGTAAGENFLLNYRRIFKDDPARGRNYDEALRLALMCLYKVAWFYTTDPDETDTMDPTFLNQAVNDARWAGRVTWNECGWVLRSMVPLYCETGDPFLKYLLRGAMERYWIGFRDDGGIAENVQIFGELETKGRRTGGFADLVHGGNMRRYVLPVADAPLRVVVGERAAIAFCKDTWDFDVAEYRYEAEGNFRFRVVSLRPDKPVKRISLIASAPFRDLRGKQVLLNGEPAEAFEFNEATNGEDVYVAGVRPGDVVQVGKLRSQTPVLVEEPPLRSQPEPDAMDAAGFACLNLASAANASLDRRWGETWFGYVPGRHTVYGVPFYLLDPELNEGRCIVAHDDGAAPAIRVGRPAKWAFLFFGVRQDEHKEGQPVGVARLTYADGTGEVVEAAEVLLADTTCLMPLRQWDLYLCKRPVRGDAAIREISVESGRLFAVTLATADTPAEALALPDAELARIEAERAADEAMQERLRHGRALRLSAQYVGSNDYEYIYAAIVDSPDLLTVPEDAFLEYDVFIPLDSAGFSGGVDLIGGTIDRLRDRGASDRHGSSHPSNRVEAAKGGWCHRRISLASFKGETFQQAVVAVDGLTHMRGMYEAYFKDIHITDGAGQTLIPLYLNDPTTRIGEPKAALRREIQDWQIEVVPVSEVRNPPGLPQERPDPEQPSDIINSDPSFEERNRCWSFMTSEGAWTSQHAHSGEVSADLSIHEGGLAGITTNYAASMRMNVEPNTTYLVSLWAKATSPDATLNVNFYDGRAYDFPQVHVPLNEDGEWRRYEVEVVTRSFPRAESKARVFKTPPPVLPALRLWTLKNPQVVYVDDVHVRRVGPGR